MSPIDDLHLAVHLIGELNRAIVAADTKAGLMLGTTGFVLAGLVAVSRTTGQHSGLATLGAVPVLLALLVCAGFLLATLRPRLPGAGRANWFSFPDFPRGTSCRPDLRELADQAWQQVALLTAIARRKHRTFRVALGWGGACLATFVFWFGVVLLIPAP